MVQPLSFMRNSVDVANISHQVDHKNQFLTLVMQGMQAVGKSETANQIMRTYANMIDDKSKVANAFKSEQKVDKVTKQCDAKAWGALTIIDTPGTNIMHTQQMEYDTRI